MFLDLLSPYVRLAMNSTLVHDHVINPRVIFDYELIYVCSGECNITYDGISRLCKKGDVVFIRPGIVHSFVTPSYTSFEQPHIHFDALYNENSNVTPISFKNRIDMSEYEKSLIQSDILADVPIPFVFKPEAPSEFRNLFYSVIHRFAENQNDTLRLKASMLELLDLIIKQFSRTDASRHLPSDSMIYSIKEYIDNNYLGIITLDMLSDQFSVNKYTALRKFKKQFGISVIEYYNRKRFECSKKFLETTDMSVKEISRMLNFTDEYSFSRFFKNIIGISPLNYKKTSRPIR